MNQFTSFYNFNDIVSLTINTSSRSAYKYFEKVFHHHKSTSINGDIPGVIFHFSDIGVNFQKPGPDYSQHIHKAASFGWYKLKIADKRIEIHVHGNRLNIGMSHHMLITSSLRYLSAKAGKLFFHSGALARDGKSIILTGNSGAGKTTLTSWMLADDDQWSLHADDYVFIDPTPQSYAFLTPPHLSLDIIKWIPELKQKLTWQDLTRLWATGSIRKYTAGKIRLPMRMDYYRLWPDHVVSTRAEPAAIFLLTRAPVNTPAISGALDPNDAVDYLLDINFDEARHFLSLVNRNDAVNPYTGWVEKWKETEKSILAKVLERVPVYTLTIAGERHHSTQVPHELSCLLSGFLQGK